MTATFYKYILNFKQASGTSRGVLNQKETWFLIIEKDGKIGIGECGLFRGLSHDDRLDYSGKLQWVCNNIKLGKDALWDLLREWPSIQFGVEQAFLSLDSNDPFVLFSSDFTNGVKSIDINGLIWMGKPDFMIEQINQKIKENFKCIKLKIGALDFENELNILKYIRENFSSNEIEIRVDANGGFNSIDALSKLNKLFDFELHSIEQPISKNQHDSMSYLCKNSLLPIALDEELIGVVNYEDKDLLLKRIQPQFIILKPSLVGGFKGCDEWIGLAEKYNIGWWITSALESNVGLNAIAQYTFLLNNDMYQGLGTGGLFTNNFASNLFVQKGQLCLDSNIKISVEEVVKQIKNGS